MKYKIKVLREVRNIDTFYIEADSEEKAKKIVCEYPDDWDNTSEYDISYWDIQSIEEINK